MGGNEAITDGLGIDSGIMGGFDGSDLQICLGGAWMDVVSSSLGFGMGRGLNIRCCFGGVMFSQSLNVSEHSSKVRGGFGRGRFARGVQAEFREE